MQEHLAQNIIDIYRKHGRAWTALRGEFLYEKDWLDRFLSFIPSHGTILDLGCGSGKPIAAYLIENGRQVTGVDSSDVMIAMAKENFPAQIWLHQDMRDFDLVQSFDGILAWDSFFHLTRTQQEHMFVHFAAHANIGTVLMFTSGTHNGEAIGEMFGDALYHASLSPEQYRSLLDKHGFKVEKVVAEDKACAGHTIWLAKKIR